MKNKLLEMLAKKDIAYQAVVRSLPLDMRSVGRYLRAVYSIYRAGETASMPIFLGIETTACCNLKCTFCPRTKLMERSVGHMPWETFKKAIDEVKPIFVTLSQFGEPLLHPQLEQFISYAKTTVPVVRLTTNATLLSDSMCERLCCSGIDHIMVSFDSCKKARYEAMRVGATFDDVVDNVKRLIGKQQKGKPFVSFNVTVTKDNIDEIGEMLLFCLDEFGLAPTFTMMYAYGEQSFMEQLPDSEAIRHIDDACQRAHGLGLASVENNLMTLKSTILRRSDIIKYPCFWPYYTTSISWDGAVYPCCVHFDCQKVMGNITDSSFDVIWNGVEYRDFRNKLNGGKKNIKLCATCSLSDITLNNALYYLDKANLFGLLTKGRRYEKI